MLEKLEKNKSVPKPSRDEIMAMTCTALENVSFDKERAFKSLFLTNSLDGKEDYLVSIVIKVYCGSTLSAIMLWMQFLCNFYASYKKI